MKRHHRTNTTPAPTTNKPAAPSAPLTEMVREALAAGKSDLGEIISWVRAKHGVTLQRPFVVILKAQIEAEK